MKTKTEDLSAVQLLTAMTTLVVAGLFKMGLITAVIFGAWNAMPVNKDRPIQPMDAFGAAALLLAVGSVIPQPKS